MIDVNSTKALKKRIKADPYYWIELYALSQYHFDEAGIGLERTLEIKRQIIGWESLEEQSVYKLKKLIDALRKEYKRRLNDKTTNGNRPR